MRTCISENAFCIVYKCMNARMYFVLSGVGTHPCVCKWMFIREIAHVSVFTTVSFSWVVSILRIFCKISRVGNKHVLADANELRAYCAFAFLSARHSAFCLNWACVCACRWIVHWLNGVHIGAKIWTSFLRYKAHLYPCTMYECVLAAIVHAYMCVRLEMSFCWANLNP